MALNAFLLIAGLLLVVFGADWLVDGSSAVARRLGVSEFIIGLTIVGFGTSCPELVVSLTGALQGNADISVGNVIGSNICNTFLILGLTSLLAPVAITKSNSLRDIPIVLLVTVLFLAAGFGGGMVSRLEGIVFLLIFAAYLFYCFKSDSVETEESEQKEIKAPLAVLMILGGLAGLVVGGRLFVDNAQTIARAIGVSDKVIAITVLAVGTSLPELVTCVVAALKHKDQLALGNVLGSNVFNILLVLGCSASVMPISMAAVTTLDAAVLLLSAALVWLWTYTGKKYCIDRWEGGLMFVCYFVYIAMLFVKM